MEKKFILTAFNYEHAKFLVTNYHSQMNRLVIGGNKYSLRHIGEFNLSQIKKTAELTSINNVKLFVNVNKIMHNRDLNSLEFFLKELDDNGVDGVTFSDLAVLSIVKSKNLNLLLEYITETTITNTSFSKFAFDNECQSIELAKEITLDEIHHIAENKKSQISIYLHGHLYMYQSVRKLLNNYLEFQKKDIEQKDYFLFDSERKVYYPIIENEQGTHILSSNDLCMVNYLDKINIELIDGLKIDGFGYTESNYNDIIATYLIAYKLLIENPNKYQDNKNDFLNEIKTNNPQKKFSTGFFYKETIY